MSPYSRRPPPTSTTTACCAPRRSSNCSPLGRSNGKAVDDVAQDARVGVDLAEPRPRTVGGLVREASGSVGAVTQDVAVPVEDVVDDLEEQAELFAERTPRALLRLGQLCDPERETNRRRK